MAFLARLKRLLTSPRIILFLILAIGISCLLGVLIPQKFFRGAAYYERLAQLHPDLYRLLDFLGLSQIYTSSWFLVLAGIFFLALAITVWDQFSRLAPKSTPLRLSPQTDYLPTTLTIKAGRPGHELQEPIRKAMRDAGYRLLGSADDETGFALVFGRHRYGRWGSPIFHLGLLVLVGAALYALAFHSRGYLQAMEKEDINGQPKDWLVTERGLLAPELTLDFSFRLDQFTVRYWPDDAAKEVEGVLTLTPDNGQEQVVTLPASRPFRFQGTTLYQSNDEFGYAVTLILKKPAEPGISTHFLLKHPKTRDQPFVAETDFPLTNYIFNLRLFPDEAGPSLFLARPILDLTVRQGEAIIFQDWLPLGGAVSFAGNEVYFTNVRYWTGITAVKGYAMKAVYLGSGLSVLGLTLLYFPIPRKIFIRLQASDQDQLEIALAGEVKRYPYDMAAELEKLARKVHKEIC